MSKTKFVLFSKCIKEAKTCMSALLALTYAEDFRCAYGSQSHAAHPADNCVLALELTLPLITKGLKTYPPATLKKQKRHGPAT
jgi:hypothetical protein